jgi:hypothetical protein
MSATKLVFSSVAASLLLGAGYVPSAAATSPERDPYCVFHKHQPVHVAPYSVDAGLDWGSYSYMGGAQLFVPAREGLTREWLSASVQEALASAHIGAAGSGKAICDMPRVNDVHVAVVSASNGFWVQLIGRDGKTSKQLLSWAKGMLESRKALSARAQ